MHLESPGSPVGQQPHEFTFFDLVVTIGRRKETEAVPSINKRTDRFEVSARNGARDPNSDAFASIQQFPLCLVVLAIEQDTLMMPEVFGFGWRFAILQIFGGGDDIADLATNLLGNQRRVSQFTKANGDIDIFSDQIQKHVCDEKVDLDARIDFQEIRNESEKWVLPQNHGHGDLE